jgi:hypothetical protein
MKLVLMYLLLSASLGALAQGNVQTFTSAKGIYQFTYPTYFVRCLRDVESGSWTAEDCLGMIPVCPQPEETDNAVCFAYPKARYKEYPELEVSDALSVPQSGKKTVVIHGVSFTVFEEGGSAAGSSIDGNIYHVFHHGKCYELGTRFAFISSGLAEPIKHLSKADWKRLDNSLWQVAQSFKFLK